MNRNLLVIVALGTLLPAIASAASFTSPVRDVASISEPESGATRLLFTADLAVPEEHVALRRALLRVPVGSRESTEQMVLRVHPVTTAWSRGAVDWSSGWTRAGGDLEGVGVELRQEASYRNETAALGRIHDLEPGAVAAPDEDEVEPFLGASHHRHGG